MNTQKIEILKEKFEQISAIIDEITDLYEDTAVIVAIKSKDLSYAQLHGNGANIAAILAATARKTDGFADVLKMAIDAHENA